MLQRHPETELVPYLRGELGPRPHRRVASHVEACAKCRQAVEDYRGALATLAGSVPEPPAIRWTRYRAELAARIAERRPSRLAVLSRLWSRPVPAALGAALAGVLLLLTIQFPLRSGSIDPGAVGIEEVVLGHRLDLLERFAVLERIELFEELDVIGQLDELPDGGEG